MTLEWRYILNSTLLGELELDHNPVGWDGAENTLSRDEVFQGIFNNYSKNSLLFTGNGYDYLKSLYATYGLAIQCSITVRHWSVINQVTTDEYIGILNGRTYNEVDKYGGAISINIGEGNFQEKLLNRADTIVNYHQDIGIDGQLLTIPPKKYADLNLIGQDRKTKAYFSLPDGEYDSYLTGGSYYWGLVELIQDTAKSNNDNAQNIYYGQVEFDKLVKCANGCWAYRTPANVQAVVNISAFMAIASRVTANYRVKFQIWKADVITNVDESIEDPNFITNLVEIYDQKDVTNKSFLSGVFNDTGAGNGAKTLTIEDLSIQMSPNQCLLFVFQIATDLVSGQAYPVQYTAVNKGTTQWYLENFEGQLCATTYTNYISLDIVERPSPKMVSAISAFNLWRRVLESITGSLDCFTSTLLTDEDSEFTNVMRFNGYMARGFASETLDKSGFSVSLNDLFKTDSVLFDAGLGVDENGEAIFESLDEFYTDEVVLTIDTVEKETWEKETIPGMFYANIEAGYDEADYKEDGGTEEYNSKSSYSTPVSNVDTKLELLPAMRGDGFAISSAMILGASSTDTQYDTDNFFVDSIYKEAMNFVQPSGLVITIYGGYFQRNKDGFDTVEGIDDITTPMNLNFTPASLVVRNSERFTNGFEFFESHDLKFSSQTIPTNLATLKTGSIYQIKESTTIPLSELKLPRFSGELIKFGWKLTFADFAYLKLNRYGKIKVKNPITKEYEFGWIKEIVQTTLTDKANFVLLRCYNQNDPSVSKVMVDHNLSYIVTDNANKISVNE